MRRLVPAALLLIAVYVVTASLAIDRPGPNQDELISVNAALGELDGTFVHKRWGSLPVMLMPYVGALKAYLTAPVFAVFGVSEATVRLPAIVLSALGLLLLALGIARLFGPGLALATLALTVVDPSFVMATRLDYGFVVLGFVARAGALLAFAGLLRTGRAWWLVPLFLSLGVGLFNKLDFIWFVNGFLAGAGSCFGRDLLAFVRARSGWRRHALALGSLAATAALLGAFALAVRDMRSLGPEFEGQAVSLGGVLESRVPSNLVRQLSGELFFNHTFGVFEAPLGPAARVVLPALLLLGLVLALVDPGGRLRRRREYFFVVVVLLVTALQIAATPAAVWAWHTFATCPLLGVALAWSLDALARSLAFSARWQRAGRLLAGGLLVAIVAHQGATYAAYLRALQGPVSNTLWSPAIHELIDYTRGERGRFVSVDWGLHVPLMTFTGQRDKFWDIAYALNREELPGDVADQLESGYLDPRLRLRFILHPEEGTAFPLARQHFLAVVAERGYVLDLVHEIREGDRVVYQVFVTRREG